MENHWSASWNWIYFESIVIKGSNPELDNPVPHPRFHRHTSYQGMIPQEISRMSILSLVKTQFIGPNFGLHLLFSVTHGRIWWRERLCFSSWSNSTPSQGGGEQIKYYVNGGEEKQRRTRRKIFGVKYLWVPISKPKKWIGGKIFLAGLSL